MTGGPVPCADCGSYFCGTPNDLGITIRCDRRMGRNEFMLRPKDPIVKTIFKEMAKAPDPFEQVEADLIKAQSGPTGDDLVTYLTAYIGDAVFAKRFADCIDLIKRKNADYTQGTAQKDRIAAFRRVAGDIDTPMRKVWATFAQKHWGAVMKYIKDGQVESEPIDGRINDLINYFVLLGAIIDDEKGLRK